MVRVAHSSKDRAPWLALLLLLATVLAAAGVWARDDKGELRRLSEEIAAKEAALRDLSQQERSITRALGELDESLARLDARGEQLAQRAQKSQERLTAAERNAAVLTGKLEQTEARLRARLRRLTRLGPGADLQVVLGSRSLKDLLWRRTVLRRLAEDDAELAAKVSRDRAALLQERSAILEGRKAQQRARAEVEQARDAAREARQGRAEALTQVALQKGAAQRRLMELANARHRLQRLVEDLPPAADATGFAALKGRLPAPVAGTIMVGFGPRMDPATKTPTVHSGLSIKAPLGEPVRAVAKGRVVHAGWLRGFGQLLIVDHGDGFHTLMAHLSRINVQGGDTVARSDVVAYVGDSESLEGPALYFELRAHGRPVDPQRWLAH